MKEITERATAMAEENLSGLTGTLSRASGKKAGDSVQESSPAYRKVSEGAIGGG